MFILVAIVLITFACCLQQYTVKKTIEFISCIYKFTCTGIMT